MEGGATESLAGDDTAHVEGSPAEGNGERGQKAEGRGQKEQEWEGQ